LKSIAGAKTPKSPLEYVVVTKTPKSQKDNERDCFSKIHARYRKNLLEDDQI
jgi:hypothetical protein